MLIPRAYRHAYIHDHLALYVSTVIHSMLAPTREFDDVTSCHGIHDHMTNCIDDQHFLSLPHLPINGISIFTSLTTKCTPLKNQFFSTRADPRLKKSWYHPKHHPILYRITATLWLVGGHMTKHYLTAYRYLTCTCTCTCIQCALDGHTIWLVVVPMNWSIVPVRSWSVDWEDWFAFRRWLVHTCCVTGQPEVRHLMWLPFPLWLMDPA